MYTDDEQPAVVIDNGSGSFRLGLAGDDFPRYCFPSVIGKYKFERNSMDGKKTFIGDEVIAKRSALIIQSPFQGGFINNWEDMERIWHHAFFNELRVKPEDQPVLLTEPMFFQESNREKMTQIFFETFNVPKFQTENEAILTLYSEGRCTGVVVQSGENCTYIVPIYEGEILSYAALRIHLAGKSLTLYLCNIMNELGYSFMSSMEMEMVTDMKEKLCYVALDYEEEIKKYKESQKSKDKNKSYELPDGNLVVIENRRFRCPELLFNPDIIGCDFAGIHELTYKQILKCKNEIRRDLYSNIILQGGTTLLPGFQQRLQKEITNLAPSQMKIKIIAHPDARCLPWIGGSIVSSMSAFKNKWITRSEYDENGPTIVHRKR